MANVKLMRLKIDKYRNVAPGTELVFNDTFNIPLGQNGTGKTTLLDLIAMVVKSDFSKLKDEEFLLEFDVCFLSIIVVSARIENRYRKSADVAPHKVGQLSLDMSTIMAETLEWEYSAAVNFKADVLYPKFELKVSPHSSELRLESGETHDVTDAFFLSPFESSLLASVLMLSTNMSFSDSTSITSTNEELQARSVQVASAFDTSKQVQLNLTRNAGRFDEALGGFDAITGSYSGVRGGDLERARLRIRRRKEKIINSSWAFVPGEIRERLIQDSSSALGSQDFRLSSSTLPFLHKVVEIFNLKSADVVLRLVQKEPGGIEKISYGNFEFIITLDDGTTIRQDLLSYGQKRLLSFFYYVAAINDIVIADELVNGLHYDWIEACLREIGDCQSFLTSQNPLLLDFLTFESAEQVKRTFILCRTEKRDGKNLMVWSNMSDEAAETFFRAYKTEALQVNEILRSRGLW
ncbi:MAG: AAA family ATPase [Polyangiaceae bacterium]|nr:AAA family ATPase [Polyangiaceae bacterium]